MSAGIGAFVWLMQQGLAPGNFPAPETSRCRVGFPDGIIGGVAGVPRPVGTLAFMVILRFMQSFLDIALWRKGPQDLPASSLLAALVLIGGRPALAFFGSYLALAVFSGVVSKVAAYGFLKIVLPRVEHYDVVYKQIVRKVELFDVSASISMEVLKSGSAPQAA